MKIFMSDLDGTLLFGKQDIHEDDIQAINKLKDHDILFGIATGRDYGFCKRLMQRYHLPIEMMILNNGGSVIVHDERIMEMVLQDDEVMKIMQYLTPYVGDLHPFLCDEEQSFYFLKNRYSKQDWQKVQTQFAYLGNICNEDAIEIVPHLAAPIIKLTICVQDVKNTKYYLNLLQQEFQHKYEVLMTAPDYIEFTRKGVHKGSALQALQNHLHLCYDDVYFIGDGENDISMMELSGHSFAMDSALKSVKEKANDIAFSVCDAIEKVIDF